MMLTVKEQNMENKIENNIKIHQILVDNNDNLSIVSLKNKLANIYNDFLITLIIYI